MALQGVAWGISVAGWIMSPIISKLLDKVLSYCKFDKEETLHRLLTDVLPRLTLTLEAAEAINHRLFFEAIVKGLKSAFYDIEEILDDLEYIRHQKMLDEQKRSSSKQKKKRPKTASSGEAGPSNQGICIEPSLTLTAALNVRLKDKMATVEKLIDKAQGVIALANPSTKAETITAKKINTRTMSAPMVKVIGRDQDRGRITEMLRDRGDDVNPSSSNSKCFSVIGIHGMSGSGKTTLAQHVCKNEKSNTYFDHVMWIHVSQNFSVGDIFKEMFEAASVDKDKACPNYNSLDVLEKELEKKLDGKRFLLVLDDIWSNKDVTEQQLLRLLSPLNVGKRGSKILATSRNKDAFSELGPGVVPTFFQIPALGEQVFLELFMYYALEGGGVDDPDQTELRIVGAEIAQKLKGSPLAASTVGGQLRRRQTNVQFWREVRDRDLLNETTGALWWSYQHLDEHVRRCFAYCSMFPRRYHFKIDELVRLWVAEGFIQTTNPEEDMEALGRDYFHELLATSFVQPIGPEYLGFYSIHDLMHDIAEKAAGSDCFRIENGSRGKVPSDVRHLFVADSINIAEEILQLENLRTLIIVDNESRGLFNEKFLEKVFDKLKKLRVLSIEVQGKAYNKRRVYKIPATVGHLKHLRCFSIFAPRRRIFLPRTLANLYHLQLLRVFGEVELSPDINMGNLTNFRRISSDAMQFPNIGSLTSLQKLDQFQVRTEHGYELKQLSGLNKLQGSLRIEHLENVKNKKEAHEAKLADKKSLKRLSLFWGNGTGTEVVHACSPEVQLEVLEGLCPPKDLENLGIWDYYGLRYPNWMVGEENGGPKYLHGLALGGCIQLGPAPELFEFFIHLRKFSIYSCDWDHLPQNMKDLRLLKELTISSCPCIKSLPELPRSLKEFTVYKCNAVFMRSCTQIGHPNWRKIQHVDVKEIAIFTDDLSSSSEEFYDSDGGEEEDSSSV